jgi:hypothetical protein
MKLCRNCIHVQKQTWGNHKCLHQDSAFTIVDPYDGTERTLHSTVTIARSSLGACGPEGTLWEPPNVNVGFI